MVHVVTTAHIYSTENGTFQNIESTRNNEQTHMLRRMIKNFILYQYFSLFSMSLKEEFLKKRQNFHTYQLTIFSFVLKFSFSFNEYTD